MKTLSANKIWFLNGVVVGALLFLAGLWGFLSMMEWATAATYNVYFNNVEQGANSTAAPTLHISDSKPVGAQPTSVSETRDPAAEPSAAEPNKASEPKASESQLPVGASTAARIEALSESSNRWFRLSFLGTSNLSGSDPRDDQGGKKAGAMLMGSIFPLRDFGINAFAGVAPAGKGYYGGELEFDPLHLGLFGLDHLIDAGFVVGASSMGQREGFDIVHSGVRMAVNFGPHYSIVGGLRTHLNQGEGDRDWLADAGVSIRF
jgi:hypothetical protein